MCLHGASGVHWSFTHGEDVYLGLWLTKQQGELGLLLVLLLLGNIPGSHEKSELWLRTRRAEGRVEIVMVQGLKKKV